MTESDKFDSYEIKHRGPHLKFCVIRKSDNSPVREGLETKGEAHNWLQEFARAQ
jgi:hypothetical protein